MKSPSPDEIFFFFFGLQFYFEKVPNNMKTWRTLKCNLQCIDPCGFRSCFFSWMACHLSVSL
jgi:hypothetical protein